jgi:hypothetical protein
LSTIILSTDEVQLPEDDEVDRFFEEQKSEQLNLSTLLKSQHFNLSTKSIMKSLRGGQTIEKQSATKKVFFCKCYLGGDIHSITIFFKSNMSNLGN